MEFDAPGDGCRDGFARLAGGKPPAFLVLRGLARSGPSRTEKTAGGFGKDVASACPAGQWKAAIVPVAAARECGKLIRSGGMPRASIPAPMSWQMAR